jgi:hypothetical protein
MIGFLERNIATDYFAANSGNCLSGMWFLRCFTQPPSFRAYLKRLTIIYIYNKK